ncbi:TPA: type I toxin-antitoxin system Ibs family toxin [Escherichia coli]|nr:type I toxin-antitoxin system Ibs family toxin [Escherichia coli]HBB7432483.1 type I toxin-antitoxin system Ibs family toxin [Escherichia coli]
MMKLLIIVVLLVISYSAY